MFYEKVSYDVMYQAIDDFQQATNIMVSGDVMEGEKPSEETLENAYDTLMKVKPMYDVMMKLADKSYNQSDVFK